MCCLQAPVWKGSLFCPRLIFQTLTYVKSSHKAKDVKWLFRRRKSKGSSGSQGRDRRQRLVSKQGETGEQTEPEIRAQGGRQGLGLPGGSLHLPKKGGSSYFSETTSWVLPSLHTPHLVISNSTDR